MHLGVNIDHVATLRQARYATMLDSHNVEPDIVAAARAAQAGGADSITLHVREDRRHMQDADAFAVRREVNLPLNLEMGATQAMLEFALQLKPDFVCLVPERREEITTEGGLDVAGHLEELRPLVAALLANGSKVSMFIDPDAEQVRASAAAGAPMIELHPGRFANTLGEERLQRLFEKVHEIDRFYDEAFTSSPEADVMQEKLDARLRQIYKKGEFFPFAERYPFIKQFQYGRKKK